MQTHWKIPVCELDKKVLDRIKRKQMVNDIKSWFTVNKDRRYNFAVLDNIRSMLYR